MDPSKIRKKIGRFRILVIGRANAGKTTILQKVCNTRDNPEIFNSAGEKIDIAVLTASRERGLHDIENEMVFRSNPGFVFHDSRGFEAGGESEFDKVKDFIGGHSKETRLTNQLHAIWYCIPMDEASRSFTEAEINFFSQCDTGIIPVMVLFTKFDALYDVEFAKLKKKGVPRKDAKEPAPKHAEESFANGPQLKFLEGVRHPPKCHVCLPNMDKDDADCRSLIKRTAGTLDEVLQQLFVSSQETNLELCMKYAVERTFPTFFDSAETPASEGQPKVIGKLGAWFPHILLVCLLILSDMLIKVITHCLQTAVNVSILRARAMLIEVIVHCSQWAVNVSILRARAMLIEVIVHCSQLGVSVSVLLRARTTLIKVIAHCSQDVNVSILRRARAMLIKVIAHCSQLASGSSPPETIVQLCSAAVIIFEHSFFIFDKRRHLQDQQKSVPSFYVALEQYMASPHAAAVREAVGAAVHTCQGTPSTWKAKLPFGRFQKKGKQSAQKMELIKTILEITLEHRLPRP